MLTIQNSSVPTKGGYRTQFLSLVFISALLIFPSIRRPGLAGYDDAVYAHEGKEMLRSGDWWNVRFNGDLNFEYPPLFLWLEAGSFELFGISDSAAKLPTALLGFGTILLLYSLTYELTQQVWVSLLAMLVLASTQFFLKNATHAMTDVPFTFFFTFTLFFYVKGLKSKVYLTLLGLPLGLAFLTRSVIGCLAVAIILSHLVWTKRQRFLYSPSLLAGLSLAICLPSVWYISQYQLHGTASFISHVRFVTNKMHSGLGAGQWSSIFNYPIAMLKYYWPWLPFLLAGVYSQTKSAVRKRDDVASFLILWVLLVIVPFSLLQTRYPRYILPAFPAFSILSAISLDRCIPRERRALFLNLACGVGCAAICVANLYPPRPRALDMSALVPIVEANSLGGESILIYSYEDGRSDYFNQFLWYGHRYATLAQNLDDLAARLNARGNVIVVMDKPSYAKLLPMISSTLSGRLRTLGESQDFVCFR